MDVTFHIAVMISRLFRGRNLSYLLLYIIRKSENDAVS